MCECSKKLPSQFLKPIAQRLRAAVADQFTQSALIAYFLLDFSLVRFFSSKEKK